MAWNEPGGEKRNPWNRPQQAQNDLDDVLRNFQRRLSALFGGGSGGGALEPGPCKLQSGLSSALVLIAAVWIGSGIYESMRRSAPSFLRFGKYEQTMGPGYNWHLRRRLERKIIVNVSRTYSVTDDASMLTADTNLVEVKSAVQYTQPDPLKLLFKVRDVEETLNQVSESAMREAVGQASLDKALAFDPSIPTGRACCYSARWIRTTWASASWSVNLTDVNVPEAVQDAQRDAIKADKDRSAISRKRSCIATTSCRGHAVKPQADAGCRSLSAARSSPWRRAKHRASTRCLTNTNIPAVTRERMYLTPWATSTRTPARSLSIRRAQ